MSVRRPKRSTRLAPLARRVELAREELHLARLALARATIPGDDTIVSSRWVRAHRLLERLEAQWLARPGVAGIGLGTRWHGGQDTGEPSLTVFVREKLTPGELRRRKYKRFPRHVGTGPNRLRVDVVRLRPGRRQANAGDSLGPAGSTLSGTIGAAARAADGSRYAITAMHVMGLAEFPDGSQAAPRVVVPAGGAAIAGVLVRGTLQGIDAAAIRLVAGFELKNQAIGVGPLRGWRIVAYPSDLGIPVQLCGASSGYLPGRLVYTSVTLKDLGLRGAILSQIATRHGDSGAALVDSTGLVLGFLCGRASADFGHLAAFSPAGKVLEALGCDIPTTT